MEVQVPVTYKRRAFRITHQKYQTSFLLLFFSIGIVTTVISLIAMRMTVIGLADMAGSIDNLSWDQIRALLDAEAQKTALLIVIASATNIIFTGIIAFYFSHHVAGIMLRMTNTLQKWSAGEAVTPIVPRKGDFFLELVEQVNEVIKSPKA